MTKIEWTQETWNVFTGCTKISMACQNCYAERFLNRFKEVHPKFRNGFKFTFHEEELERPYRWKKPRLVFVNSISDTFHEEVTEEQIAKIWKVMEETPHVYQVLTKRIDKALKLLNKGVIYPLSNVWMGVTVEHSKYLHRLEMLAYFGDFPVRFVSIEPMLSSMPEIREFLEDGIVNWVIVGGETGIGARPMREEWVWEIKELCERYEVPFFFKQWGGERGKGGRLLGGREYNEFPKEAAVCCK